MGDGILTGAGASEAWVRFDVLWRPASAADGGSSDEHPLCSFTNRFLRNPAGPFLAVPYAADATAPGAETVLGDQLLLRMTLLSGSPGVFFAPTGDGASAQGAIPHLDLAR